MSYDVDVAVDDFFILRHDRRRKRVAHAEAWFARARRGERTSSEAEADGSWVEEAGERTVVVSEAKGSKESRSNNDHRLGLTSGFAPFHFLLRFTDFIVFIVVDGNDGPM